MEGVDPLPYQHEKWWYPAYFDVLCESGLRFPHQFLLSHGSYPSVTTTASSSGRDRLVDIHDDRVARLIISTLASRVLCSVPRGWVRLRHIAQCRDGERAPAGSRQTRRTTRIGSRKPRHSNFRYGLRYHDVWRWMCGCQSSECCVWFCNGWLAWWSVALPEHRHTERH